MVPIESLITFAIASLLLGVAPGPDNIFVFAQSTLHGWKNGVVVSLGLCTGLIGHTCAVTFGVAVIFQTSAFAFTLLKTVGAAYLLYLAWQAFRTSGATLEGGEIKQLTAGRLYCRGIIMNITNPKVSIFFLAFLPQFASPANGSMAIQMVVLGVVFTLVTIVLFSGIALTAGTLGSRLNRSPRIQVFINRIAGTVFVGLALKLITVSVDT